MDESQSEWHLMAKCAEGRQAMHALPGVDRARPEHLLHWTVLPLAPGLRQAVPLLREALREIDFAPFTFLWDRRVAARRYLMLQPSHVPREVPGLRRAIRKSLKRLDLPLLGKATRPHVTLSYRWDGPAFEEPVEPIAWGIEEILLVESLTGRKTHEVHGRFSLLPRQGVLFPWMAGSRGTLAPACR